MTNEIEIENKPEMQMATLVRFTEVQAKRLGRDRFLTGKSIPSLLKERYFESAPLQPVMSVEDVKEIQKQIICANRNLNQSTKYMHMGIFDSVVEDHHRAVKLVAYVAEIIANAYGNRKNSV